MTSAPKIGRVGKSKETASSPRCSMGNCRPPSANCSLAGWLRDEALRAQWSRFALIGAALRAERGVSLTDRVAWRVQSAVAQEPTYGDSATADAAANSTRSSSAASPPPCASGGMRFARPVMGASIAAGVAAMSIMWLRTQGPEQELVASAPVSESIVLTAESGAHAGYACGHAARTHPRLEW